jgi:hypothetical protein
MALAQWVYDKTTFEFLRGGFADFPFNEAVEGRQEYADASQPDPKTERFDAAAPSKKRPATQQELDAQVLAERDRIADRELTVATVKATLEVILRRTTPTWSSMTGPQKNTARAAILAEWKQIFAALT